MDVLDIVYSMNTVDSLQDNINYALKNLHNENIAPSVHNGHMVPRTV